MLRVTNILLFARAVAAIDASTIGRVRTAIRWPHVVAPASSTGRIRDA